MKTNPVELTIAKWPIIVFDDSFVQVVLRRPFTNHVATFFSAYYQASVPTEDQSLPYLERRVQLAIIYCLDHPGNGKLDNTKIKAQNMELTGVEDLRDVELLAIEMVEAMFTLLDEASND